MPDQLAECLKEAKQSATSDYVIANRDGDPLSYTQFKRVWQYIVTRSTKERTYVRYINGQKITKTVTPVLGEKAGHNSKVVYSLDFQVTPHQLRHPYVKHKTKSFLRNSRVFKADFCAPSHSLCTEVFHFPDNINLISGVNIHTFNQCVSQGGI